MVRWERVRSKPRILCGQGGIGPSSTDAQDALLTFFSSYIQKFYQMKTQLQAVSLRIQTVRSNEQMMQSMKGATSLLGSMNRSMNLPALQRIAMDFERENDIMEQRQEMMDDAIDDVTGLDDDMESDEIVNQVLDEIGVEMNQTVSLISRPHVVGLANNSSPTPSSAKPPPQSPPQIQSTKERLRRRSVRTRWTTICRQDSIV